MILIIRQPSERLASERLDCSSSENSEGEDGDLAKRKNYCRAEHRPSAGKVKLPKKTTADMDASKIKVKVDIGRYAAAFKQKMAEKTNPSPSVSNAADLLPQKSSLASSFIGMKRRFEAADIPAISSMEPPSKCETASATTNSLNNVSSETEASNKRQEILLESMKVSKEKPPVAPKDPPSKNPTPPPFIPDFSVNEVSVSTMDSAHSNYDVAFVMLHKSALPSDRKKIKELSEAEIRRTQLKGLALVKDCTTELAIRDEIKSRELRKAREGSSLLKQDVLKLHEEKKLLQASIDAHLIDQLKNQILDLEKTVALEKAENKTQSDFFEDREKWYKNQLSLAEQKLETSSETVASQQQEISDLQKKNQALESTVAELTSSKQKTIDELTAESNRIVNEKVQEQLDAFMALHGIDVSSIE